MLLTDKIKWVFLLILIPVIFWTLSKTIPWVVSGVNWLSYRYLAQTGSGEKGLLTIFSQRSKVRRFISDFKLPLSRNSDHRFNHERFKLKMVGLFNVERTGRYQIGTDSDDGSWIWIDGKKILDNGGLHPRRIIMNTLLLKKGIHTVQIEYENLLGDAYLDVFWSPAQGTPHPLNFYSYPLGWLIHLPDIFFKIAQYWTFFLAPFLLYPLLLPAGRHKNINGTKD